MNVACQTCGQSNPPEARQCQFCGAAIAATPIYRDPFRTRPQQPPGADRWSDLQPPYAQSALGLKEPSAGLLLELIPGLFGFLGIGYLWSGEVALGVGLLVGYWLVGGLLTIFTILTVGLLLCCFPLFLLYYPGIPIISAVLLHRRLLQRQESLVRASARPYPF